MKRYFAVITASFTDPAGDPTKGYFRMVSPLMNSANAAENWAIPIAARLERYAIDISVSAAPKIEMNVDIREVY